ncbi:MAG: hypothetical protein AAFQ41_10630 [Cyanobacteria bacterium J06623_7]
MLKVTVQDNAIAFGNNFALNFQRTLRIPDDGQIYPLPPGLGTFPICRVEDYRDTVPISWLNHGGVFIPMYQREALWISFKYDYWQPHAVKVGVGNINVVSGLAWHPKLAQQEADYLVAPPQPWLDGINAGDEYIKQFVAMPLGWGHTVEGQITGKEEFGGIQIVVYEPKPGKFAQSKINSNNIDFMDMELERSEGAMGIAAGGKMRQKIYADVYGIDTWNEHNYGLVHVHIVNSMLYRQITGLEPPKTPVMAQTYAHNQLPWFSLYDEIMSDIPTSSALSSISSIREIDAQKQAEIQQNDDSVDISDANIIELPMQNPTTNKDS